MTATDVLRRMLDERGVEWGNIRRDGSESDYLTEWQFEDNQGKAIAIEWAVGSGLSVEVHRYRLTPEQAIAATLGRGVLSASQVSNAVYAHSIHADCADADWQAIADELNATLGRGTCHITDSGPWGHPYVCSACGASFDPDVRGGEFNFCPNCGARIEVWTHEHD